MFECSLGIHPISLIFVSIRDDLYLCLLPNAYFCVFEDHVTYLDECP